MPRLLTLVPFVEEGRILDTVLQCSLVPQTCVVHAFSLPWGRTLWHHLARKCRRKRKATPATANTLSSKKNASIVRRNECCLISRLHHTSKLTKYGQIFVFCRIFKVVFLRTWYAYLDYPFSHSWLIFCYLGVEM